MKNSVSWKIDMIKSVLMFFIIISLILFMILIFGCTPMGDTDVNELHDDRVTVGCLAVSLEGKTKWVSPASGELAKAFCSDNLPDCFEFHYDRNGLKVNVITPCEVDITDE